MDCRDGWHEVSGGGPLTAGSPDYSVRAVERVCDILDVFQIETGSKSLSEIALSVGLPKSSTLRYLATLEERGYVVRDQPHARYRGGHGLLAGRSDQVEALRASMAPILVQLRDHFNETINLGTLEGAKVRYLSSVEPQRGVRFSVPADQVDFVHSTALGKVLMAALPDTRVRKLLNTDLPAVTTFTITDRELYIQELHRVREQGFALDDRENDIDARCVAVPLHSSMLAGVSLSAPLARLPVRDSERLATELRSWIEHSVKPPSSA